MSLCDTIRVSHSNLTKQTLLAHTVAQFVEKQYMCRFFSSPCIIRNKWV